MIRGQSIKRSLIDYPLLTAMILLVIIGSVSVLSAVGGTAQAASVTRTHLMALPIGAMAFMLGWLINYQVFNERWKFLYGFTLALLLAVLLFGATQRGSRSWFVFPFFSVQPSEICRIASLLIVAAVLERYKKIFGDLGLIATVAVIMLPIAGLIMLQPDFSSLVVTFPAIMLLLYCSGVNVIYLIFIALFGLVAAAFPLLWTYVYMYPELVKSSKIFYFIERLAVSKLWIAGFVLAVFAVCTGLWKLGKKLKSAVPFPVFFITAVIILSGFFSGFTVYKYMKPHQKKRLEVFLSPKADPRGGGYNLLQAQIAMGSGGVLGKGFFSGTQSRLGFVPERHTDFILAVVGEEAGLLGTLAVLFLYGVILWRIMLIGYSSSDRYGFLVCGGVFAMFFTYAIINFGMLIGLAPVAGIPLPLMSYGGSNLVASMWAFGIVQSVYSRRISLR